MKSTYIFFHVFVYSFFLSSNFHCLIPIKQKSRKKSYNVEKTIIKSYTTLQIPIHYLNYNSTYLIRVAPHYKSVEQCWKNTALQQKYHIIRVVLAQI